MAQEKNLAFIDGQNLYLGTKQNDWTIDPLKLRTYLKEKYKVSEAYYFLGYSQEENSELYKEIQSGGFILLFKEHNRYSLTKKRGNVDSDIIFEIMKNLLDNKEFSRVILISGDGDYKKLVEYLIFKDKFKKILFPNKKFASSLYKKLGSEYYDYLDNIKTYTARNEKGS